jgi:hypothetical protein
MLYVTGKCLVRTRDLFRIMLCYIPIGISNIALQGTTTLTIAIALGPEPFAIANCGNNITVNTDII